MLTQSMLTRMLRMVTSVKDRREIIHSKRESSMVVPRYQILMEGLVAMRHVNHPGRALLGILLIQCCLEVHYCPYFVLSLHGLFPPTS